MGTARVYRKRRLLLSALCVVAVVVLLALLADTRAGAGSPPLAHEVASGETLWSITTEYYPAREDPRVIVEEIRRQNGLEGYGLRPGMRLELPRATDG